MVMYILPSMAKFYWDDFIMHSTLSRWWNGCQFCAFNLR